MEFLDMTPEFNVD